MFEIIMTTVLVLLIAVPAVAKVILKVNGKSMKKIFGISSGAYFIILTVFTILLSSGVVLADGTETVNEVNGVGLIAAAMSTGLATIGAGIAVASSASAAIGAMSEDSKIMGKTLIFVALAEGIALYGLLATFMILGRL